MADETKPKLKKKQPRWKDKSQAMMQVKHDKRMAAEKKNPPYIKSGHKPAPLTTERSKRIYKRKSN